MTVRRKAVGLGEFGQSGVRAVALAGTRLAVGLQEVSHLTVFRSHSYNSVNGFDPFLNNLHK